MEYLDLKARSISLEEQNSVSEEAGFCFKVPPLVTQDFVSVYQNTG
jgi:hypothetical protein